MLRCPMLTPPVTRQVYHGAVRRFAVLLCFCVVAAPGFQESQGSTDSGRNSDIYVIYSLMLTNAQTSHGSNNNERYLIANRTAPAHPPDPCVNPPKEREDDFREVLADYELRKGNARDLKPWFSIPKPYLLLTAEEVKAFRTDRSLTPEPRVRDERFRGATDLFTLSDVYFNKRHTLALTAISTWCGSLCALYQWKVFEKVGADKWEERQWVGCITVAGARPRAFPHETAP